MTEKIVPIQVNELEHPTDEEEGEQV